MTVDIDPPFSSIQNPIIEKGVTSLLNLFDEHMIKVTFFIPAVVARNFSTLMEEIVERDHEIACHGLRHFPDEGILNLNEQIRLIRSATRIIECVTGTRPIGFRAPLFKVNKNCWIALLKNGYSYDSSLTFSPLHGQYKLFLNSEPFRIAVYKGEHLIEIPVSINPFLLSPLGGGWLRIFGSNLAKIGVKLNLLYQKSVVFYIHPKDVVALQQPGLFWYNYRNTANCLKMLNSVINYAKSNGAKFLKARELVGLYNK